MSIDFRQLANSLTQNGHYRLPPGDVMLMGVVIGYDPNFNSTTNSHDYPLLSIQLEGDDAPLHGFRFAETYTPHIGDTVWVLMSGQDGWVVSSLAGQPVLPGQSNRSPRNQTVVGHGAFTSNYAKTAPTTDWQLLPVSTASGAAIMSVNTPILPNRIYKIELLLSFNATATGTNSVASVGIVTPDGASTPHQIWSSDVGTHPYTVNGMTTWWRTPGHELTPGQWTASPGLSWTWQVAIKMLGTGWTMTLDNTHPQRLIISDMGLAS